MFQNYFVKKKPHFIIFYNCDFMASEFEGMVEVIQIKEMSEIIKNAKLTPKIIHTLITV